MEVIVVLLATAFGVAGALKLFVPARGLTVASRFAGRGPIEALAVARLPWLKFALAEALLVLQFRQAAAIVCLIMLVASTAVLISSQWGEEALPCGRFGATSAGPG